MAASTSATNLNKQKTLIKIIKDGSTFKPQAPLTTSQRQHQPPSSNILQHHQKMSLTLKKPSTSHINNRFEGRVMAKSNSVVQNDFLGQSQESRQMQYNGSNFSILTGKQQSFIVSPSNSNLNQIEGAQIPLRANNLAHISTSSMTNLNTMLSQIETIQTTTNNQYQPQQTSIFGRDRITDKLNLANKFISNIKQIQPNRVTAFKSERRASLNSRVNFDLNKNKEYPLEEQFKLDYGDDDTNSQFSTNKQKFFKNLRGQKFMQEKSNKIDDNTSSIHSLRFNNDQSTQQNFKALIQNQKFLKSQLQNIISEVQTVKTQTLNFSDFQTKLDQFYHNFQKHHSNIKEGFEFYLIQDLKQKIQITNLQEQIDKFVKFEKEKNLQYKNELTQLDGGSGAGQNINAHDDIKTLRFLYEKTKKEYLEYKTKIEYRLKEVNLSNKLMSIKMNHKHNELNQLQDNLAELEKNQESKDLKNALASVALFSDEELKKRERLILKLQDDKGDLRDVIYSKEKEIKKLEEIIAKRDTEIQNLNDQLNEERQSKNEVDTNKVNLEYKLKRAKEKFYRKQEELAQQKNLTQKFRDMIQKLEKDLKKGYSNGVVVQFEEMNIDDLLRSSNLFRQPQNIYAINNTTRLSMNYRNNLMSAMATGAERLILSTWHDESKLNITRDPKMNEAGNAIEEVNFDQISLHMHNLARPTFFNFVENELQRIKSEMQKEQQANRFESPDRQGGGPAVMNRTSNNISDRSFLSIHYEKIKFEPPDRMWIFTTMRAIFDCKYAEHKILMNSDSRGLFNIQRFPEFVYQWMGKFYFDQKKCQVKSLETFDEGKVDNLRLQLLIGLQTMKPSKMWECNLFADFLEERLLNDDLHFFLHARNLLYKGPQLQDIEAAQEPMYFVEQKQIFWTVDVLFANLPTFEIQDIKKKFEMIADDKSKEFSFAESLGKLPLDSSMVLRILLEYYRNEKKAKQFIIKRLFKEFGGGTPTSSISFQQFKEVVLQIQPDILECDMAMLYRFTWMLGNGKVNFDTFFLAANESNFFVKCMQLRSIGKLPLLDHNFDIDVNSITLTYDQIELAKQQQYVVQLWYSLDKQVKIVKDYVEQLGQEDMLHQFLQFDKFIKQKGQFDSSIMQAKDIIQLMRQLVCKVIMIRNNYLEIQEQEPLLKKSAIDIQKELDIDYWSQLMNIMQNELSVLDDLKSEDIQKARNKERSNQNWHKLKDQVQKRFTMVFKLNKL